MSTIKKIEDLEIWQVARTINNDIFQLIKDKKFIREFALTDQMKRSSGSTMDNIAEGFGRSGRFEFIHFLSIAKASAAELKSQMIRCNDQLLIDNDKSKLILNNINKLNNKITAFIRYLNKSNIKGLKYMERTTNSQSDQTSEANKQQTKNILSKTTNPNSIVKTTSAAAPLGAYPHARKVGNLLFLSGIGSRGAADNAIPGLELDEQGNIVKYDIEAECHSVFANVKAVLEASGSSWDKMIDVTVFLTNMKTDFPLYNKIYGEYFAGVEACRTTVEVKSLPTPIAIELKVIAVIE